MAVSLSEITGIKGDAAIGAGTAGTAANLAALPADQIGLNILQVGANAQMLANRYAQDQYQKNLDNYFTNQFNTLDVNGIMEKDYDAVIPEYAQFSKNIADNLDVIMNPSIDYDRYKDLRSQEAQLRGKIAQSKQQLALRTGAMNFISQHPGFQTPENIDAVQQFTTTPLESRDISSLVNLQPKYDLMQDYISKAANNAAMAKTKQQNTASPFMDKTTLTTYYKNAYDGAVQSLLQGNDVFNRPLRSVVDRSFQQAPDYIKNQYTAAGTTDPDLDKFALEQVYGPLRNQDDVSIEKEINPIYKEQLDQENALKRIAASGAQERANIRLNKALSDDEIKDAASEIPVRQISIFESGGQPIEQAETIQLQGKDGARPKWSVPGNYGKIGGNGGEVKAFPLTLDTWLMNAYSIPSGKEKVVDPITRQVISEDTYMRPEKAWVTTEANPNARKVIVRYDDKNGTKDLVIPFAENYQLLNNVAGQANALKIGGAKAELSKRLTGRVNPSFEQLKSNPLFSNPNAGGTELNATEQGLLPLGPGQGTPYDQQEVAPAAVPKTLNYAEWKKQQGR